MSTVDTQRSPGRIAATALLLFPAMVSTLLNVPALVPGALAFDIQRDFALRPGEIGAAVAVFYLLSSVATQTVMPLATRLSPMTMARLGLLLGAGSSLAAASSGSKTGLFALCAVSGLANGLATPSANMLIALTVPQRRRGLAFGLRVSAVPAAAALAAMGAYAVAHTTLTWRGILLALGIVCLGLLLASYAGRTERVRPPRPTAAEAAGDGLVALRVVALGGLLAATACSTLSPFLVEGLIAGGASPANAALLLGISAWLGVVARVTAGVVADRVPRPTQHLSGAAAMLVIAAVGMVGLGFGKGTSVLATATLLTFGIGWAWPGLIHHATIVLHPGHMARATTYLQMGTFAGALIGPLGFGLMVELSSYRWAFTVTALVAAVGAVAVSAGNRLERGRATAAL